MNTIWQDLRYSTRMLKRKAGFRLITVLTLALVGNTTGGRAQDTAPKSGAGGAQVYHATLELSAYNLLFAPIKINSQEALALIDSGHYRAIQLSSNLAQLLKLSLTKTDESPRHHEGKDHSLARGRIERLRSAITSSLTSRLA
ncbi:MAG: hypothetical protein J2P21_31335 [Chloracidobacterium sp.]|nr:hypothetical protein [Chloracidobacterium sp.]